MDQSNSADWTYERYQPSPYGVEMQQQSQPVHPVAPPPPVVRAIAPLAALAYPALVWCGVHLSPAFLALSLAVPAIGAIAAHRSGIGGASPLVRGCAHLAVGSPALFALLGGWLDFQRAVPFGSLGAWIPLWSALTLAALLDRRLAPPPSLPPRRRLALAHAISGAALLLFASAHLVNHLAGLFGAQAHTAVMHALRAVYRAPLVEPVLFAALGFQVISGAALLAGRLRRRPDRFDSLQTVTGAYLLIFLASHVSAVLRARLLRGVDTDWAWLAGGELLTDAWSARLVPYYFLAVIALAVHVACGLRIALLGRGGPPARASKLVATLAAAALLASSLILLGLLRA